MENLKNSKLILTLFVVAFVLVIAATVSTFYGSKAKDIKLQQNRLIAYNYKLQQSILQKKQEYEKIADKISEVKSFIESKNSLDKSSIKKLLASLSSDARSVIYQSIPSGYPSSTKRITSSFGYRIHPIAKVKRFHYGIDFGGEIGTPIKATADGIVEFSGENGGYGNLIVLSHNFGFKTAYGHMKKNLKVKKGDFVKKGETIGYLGNSGISTGPHLHYEIKHIKNVLDPRRFIKFSKNNFESIFYKEKKIAWDSLIKSILNQYGKFNEQLALLEY
jgi:murein DD-endopeptidase MepM/ murein hydrolase activator NlpD